MLAMRQLKGKVKETRKEKRQRKVENAENKQRMLTIVVPTLVVIFCIIVAFVYLKTRPSEIVA